MGAADCELKAGVTSSSVHAPHKCDSVDSSVTAPPFKSLTALCKGPHGEWKGKALSGSDLSAQ